MKLQNNSIVYILCPPVYATGGTELLHQLCDALVTLGLDAYIFYWPKAKQPTSPAFNKYQIRITKNIEDEEKNVFIAPEIDNYKIFQYSKIQKVIWWLSVDNHFKNKSLMKSNLKLRLLNFIFRRKNFDVDMNDINSLTHFAQSQYALNFLISRGVQRSYLLSDYINDKFLSASFDPQLKEDIVLYNPKKGMAFTKKLIAASSNRYKWKAIENLTREGVFDLLKRAKVYIDFGNHPGKDRFPREAASQGCCIITNKSGSAGNEKDVAIKNDYKFEANDNDIQEILITIEKCINDYDEKIQDFHTYRRKIAGEKQVFFNEVKSVFKVH